MTRDLTYVLSAGMVLLALGCGDSNRVSGPTSPEFASSTGCNLSTAKSLVNSVFSTSSTRQAVNGYLQNIQSSGSASLAATNAGFDIFALIAANRPTPPVNGSTFVKAVLSCMAVGTLPSALDFTGALGEDGAFEVRGGSATETSAVVSNGEIVWGLEPPLRIDTTPAYRLAWDTITRPKNRENMRFLAYGAPVVVQPTAFTDEVLVGTVFDWSTIPTLTFEPGVVVGTCFTDGTPEQFLIQHHSKADPGGAEIVPSATPSFCTLGTASLNPGWSPLALARRIVDVFRPQPLLATALATRPPGGSVGALSPHAAVNPGTIALQFRGNVADGRTGQVLKFTNGESVTVKVTPTGLTKMDGVRIRLIATSNLGATVVASGNEEPTQDGFATFRNLTINKAGGYRLIATIAGFGQNNSAGFDFDNVTSNGFNLKQAK